MTGTQSFSFCTIFLGLQAAIRCMHTDQRTELNTGTYVVTVPRAAALVSGILIENKIYGFVTMDRLRSRSRPCFS
jgi:hypothetical protein